MSLSHFHGPFEKVDHPQMEPEVKRAILASWASDANVVGSWPAHAPQERGTAPAAGGLNAR